MKDPIIQFSRKLCSQLAITLLFGFSNTDFTMYSGESKITAEFKNRSISVSKWSDTFIEYPKWSALYRAWSTGDTAFFIVEYQECFVVFSLNQFFNVAHKIYSHFPEYCFARRYMATNQYEPDYKREKLVRYLQFHEAELIIDKSNLRPISCSILYERYFK